MYRPLHSSRLLTYDTFNSMKFVWRHEYDSHGSNAPLPCFDEAKRLLMLVAKSRVTFPNNSKLNYRFEGIRACSTITYVQGREQEILKGAILNFDGGQTLIFGCFNGQNERILRPGWRMALFCHWLSMPMPM